VSRVLQYAPPRSLCKIVARNALAVRVGLQIGRCKGTLSYVTFGS